MGTRCTALLVWTAVGIASALGCSEPDDEDTAVAGAMGAAGLGATGGNATVAGTSGAMTAGMPAAGSVGFGGAMTAGAAAGAPGGTAGVENVGVGGAGIGGAGTDGGASPGDGGGDPAGIGGASGGGAAGGGTGGSGGGEPGGSGGASGGEFTLTSAELMEGGMFMEAYTCASGMGFGSALSLSWSNVPAETQSFAMVMVDDTLTGMGDRLGYHAAFWNLPVSVTNLPQGSWATALAGAETINGGYLGPCPNFGGGSDTHTYIFTLYALPDATISVPGDFSSVQSAQVLIQTLESAALDTATLSGTSSASN